MSRFVKIVRYLRAFFPSSLPNGVVEFKAWSDSFSELYILPTEDKDSINYALATMVLHLGPAIAYKSKYSFYLMLKASAAKQVAGSIFVEIKENQKKKETPVSNESQG